jgi:hypothetical protein
LEVADIFRGHGPAWRRTNAGRVSLGQLKVMSAIENCRTAALGGHVARCEDCAHTTIAYNSCRNRHCPKCQGAAAKQWLAEREADLLPVPYYHVVFTLPAAISAIAYQNKAVIYDILFKPSAETLITIAADPKHLGARDFLGYHFSPAGLTVAAKTIANFIEKASRLYEQKCRAVSTATALEMYVRRWVRWTTSGRVDPLDQLDGQLLASAMK